MITKEVRSFTGYECVKRSLLAVGEKVSRNKKMNLQDARLSSRTCTRHIQERETRLFEQLKL
jgi:hypothetical protein